MEVCGAELQASGGATDGTTWACDQKDEHPGPHRMTWEMACVGCDVPLFCSTTWDRHPAGHGRLVNV